LYLREEEGGGEPFTGILLAAGGGTIRETDKKKSRADREELVRMGQRTPGVRTDGLGWF